VGHLDKRRPHLPRIVNVVLEKLFMEVAAAASGRASKQSESDSAVPLIFAGLVAPYRVESDPTGEAIADLAICAEGDAVLPRLIAAALNAPDSPSIATPRDILNEAAAADDPTATRSLMLIDHLLRPFDALGRAILAALAVIPGVEWTADDLWTVEGPLDADDILIGDIIARLCSYGLCEEFTLGRYRVPVVLAERAAVGVRRVLSLEECQEIVGEIYANVAERLETVGWAPIYERINASPTIPRRLGLAGRGAPTMTAQEAMGAAEALLLTCSALLDYLPNFLIEGDLSVPEAMPSLIRWSSLIALAARHEDGRALVEEYEREQGAAAYSRRITQANVDAFDRELARLTNEQIEFWRAHGDHSQDEVDEVLKLVEAAQQRVAQRATEKQGTA